MKKFLAIIILSMFWFNTSFGEAQPYKVGDIVKTKLEFNSGNTIIPLPNDGEYLVGVTKKTISKGAPTAMYDLMLYQTTKDNVLKKSIRITVTARTPTSWTIPKACKSDKPFFQGSYVKGKTFNCWYTGHGSTALSSKKTKPKSFYGQVRKYQLDNRIIMPDIVVNEYHLYASNNHKNRYHKVIIFHNPVVRGIEESKGKSFSTADYNPTKIMKYPKKEKFIKDITKTSAIYHKAFEDSIGVRERQKVNTSQFIQ